MQLDLFIEQTGVYKINPNKKIRLITLFSGYDSQALSLKYLGINYEHYKTCEWALSSIKALYNLHFYNDKKDYSSELSDDEVYNKIFELGVSRDYNQPLDFKKLKLIKPNEIRNIYNQITASHNLVNISKVKGEDLEIVDTNQYEYILTYSFPCQDLSLQGSLKGMNNETRSGLLYEVERIIGECKEKPQILVMENVSNILSYLFMNDFRKWQQKLEQMGYRNYINVMDAKDYGIPQHRERCFMVSILSDKGYYFLPKFNSHSTLNDILDKVGDTRFLFKRSRIVSALKTNYAIDTLESKFIKRAEISSTLMAGYTKYCSVVPENDEVYYEWKRMKFCDIEKQADYLVGKIRQYTPQECSRLMGVAPVDYHLMKKEQTELQLYHLYGDSIVSTCLMSIFGLLVYDEKQTIKIINDFLRKEIYINE